MAEWAAGQVGLHFIPAGEPWRNGYIESFNSRIRDECNITSFWSLTQARVVITDWKHDYNHHRRHSALRCQPQPPTLPTVPTNERLSSAVDEFSGSGQGLAAGDSWRAKLRAPTAIDCSHLLLTFSLRPASTHSERAASGRSR